MRRTKSFTEFNHSQRHALDTRRNLAVRANAGSGKTSVLVERIVQLLAHHWDQGTPLDLTNVVAITFTRKAAAELQDRLRGSFLELAEATENPRERAYWSERIEEIPRAMIGTIDSFCVRILREFAMLSLHSIGPDFDMQEDYETEILQHEAIDRVINRLSSLPEGDNKAEVALQTDACRWWAVNQGYKVLTGHLSALLKEMIEPARIVAAHRDLPPIAERVQRAWEQLPAVQQLKRDRTRLLRELQAIVREIDGSEDSGSKLRDLRQLLAEALGALQYLGREGVSLALQTLREALLTQDDDPRSMKPYGLVKDRLEPLQAAWIAALKSFDFDLEGEIEALEAADRLALLLGPVYEQYLQLCRETGRFDFLTIERWTRDLLAGSLQVREELKKRFHYIMVDEFQDTNHLQWEIISYLVGNGPEGRLDQERLFVVGDPQQSIYRFRQAEVGVFNRVLETIQASNNYHGHGKTPTLYDGIQAERPSTDSERLGVIPLRENYRSLKKIPLRLMDRVFQHVFDPDIHNLDVQRNKFEIEYQQLVAGVKSEAIGEVRYVIVSDQDGGDSKVEPENEEQPEDVELGNLQVEAVVDQLVSLYGQPNYTNDKILTWKDMAVLLPSRTVVLTELEKELTRRRVPYVVSGGIGFWQRQEVRDVVSLASFLADSGDELALFALLRGPVGQLTDKQILFLSQFGLGRMYRGLRLIQHAGDSLAVSADSEEEQTWQAHRQKLADLVRSVLDNYWRGIAEDERGRMRSTAIRLEGWRLRVDRMSHADLLQRCLEESGAYAIYAAEPDGEIILSNLSRLFDSIRTEEGRSAPGLARLARWMQHQVDESYKEEQATLATGKDALQIMTVHAAKGLEFPVVAIMKMERRAVVSRAKSLSVKNEWDELLAEDADQIGKVPAGTLAVNIRHPQRPRETYTPRLLKALRRLDHAQERAESRRLFYVAATRAKERLILAGKQPKQGKSGGLHKQQDGWQKWFEDALGLTEEHKRNGIWEEPGFQIRIITEARGIEPLLAGPSSLPAQRLHLDYLHERPQFPTIATTRLDQMRQLWRQDHREWWMRYQVNLIPHVADPPTDFMDHGVQEENETIGTVIGILVHRMFEMGGAVLDQPVPDKLLQAMAANLLATAPDRADQLGEESPTPPGDQSVRAVVSAVQRILNRMKQCRRGDPLRRLLEADGDAEVDFILDLGRWRVTGRFDKLLPVGESGFEIVDWKTDEYGPTTVEYYRPQMKLYALALHRSGRAALREGRIRVHLALLHDLAVETLLFSPAELDAFAGELEMELTEMDAYDPAGLTN